MNFSDSKTYANLKNAYDLELMTSAKDLMAGDRARQEGYIEISRIFENVARNNLQHARIWLRQLNNNTLPSTSEFLTLASQDESFFGNQMYREYAQTATEEGFPEIASLFNGVANIDLNHSLEFESLNNSLEQGTIFCNPDETLWICMQCGNILYGECAPEICPVCGFPQGYYRKFAPSYP